MAGQLPVLSGNEVRKAFENAGWEYVRQRGSHMVMVKEGSIATLSVPNHKTVAKGTLRSLIRAAGLTLEQFLELV
jgi:predicted RNA binding protein YcfA (HicA-like mRNA interferase family)